MSSTSRGAQRNADDFYETPAWATRAVLRTIPWEGDCRPHILEPMAGRGMIVRELRVRWPDAVITACELDPSRASCLTQAGADHVLVGDLFQQQFSSKFDLCIGNPAFSLAMPTIELGMKWSVQTSLLERLNYLGSQDRAPFWRKHPPDLLILPRRPSFAASMKCKARAGAAGSCGWKATFMLTDEMPRVCPGCGCQVSKVTTDSVEYAWFSWGPRGGGTWAIGDIA
jgi:hypothetical protein